MLYFPPLQTKRLTVSMKELTIGQAISIASMPSHMIEAACSAFLRMTVSKCVGIEDVSQWSAQERMLAVSHYLACTSDGEPDFKLANGKFSDYFDGSKDDFIESVNIGDIGGDNWTVKNLTGKMLESVERLSGEIESLPGRLYWMVGAMAAQLVMDSETINESLSDSEYDAWLLNRINVFCNFPDSQFESLMLLWLSANEKLTHLFLISFDNSGVVALPRKEVDGSLPPARFPVHSCLSRIAIQMADRND